MQQLARTLVLEVAGDAVDLLLGARRRDWPALRLRGGQMRHLVRYPSCARTLEDLQRWVALELVRELVCEVARWVSEEPDAAVRGALGALEALECTLGGDECVQAWEYLIEARALGVLAPDKTLCHLIASRRVSHLGNDAARWLATCARTEARLDIGGVRDEAEAPGQAKTPARGPGSSSHTRVRAWSACCAATRTT